MKNFVRGWAAACVLLAAGGAGADEPALVTGKASVGAIDKMLFPPKYVAIKKECLAAEAAGLKCQSFLPTSVTRAPAKVTFARGSAELSPAGAALVSKFGRVLAKRKDLYTKVLVEGHTDATGTDELNHRLSAERAETVKRVLVEKYGLSPEAVVTEGKSSDDLLNKDDPGAEINRRIEFQVNW